MERDWEFECVTIAGLGLIGGSIGLGLKRAGFSGRIQGVSRPETLEEARRLGAIDLGFPYEELAEAAFASDLVILSAPIHVILEHLRVLGRAGAKLRPGTVITDVGSTKSAIGRAAEAELPPGVHFVGGHPLAGSELRGIAAADPLLFENCYYVLCPTRKTPRDVLGRLSDFFARLGSRVVVLRAETHDRVAAAISHLPQLLAVELVNSLDALGGEKETAVRLAAGGFRDMTRIASSPFSVWRDIFQTNREEVLAALERFRTLLQSDLGTLDAEVLEQAFERAARTRAAIPRDTKGFLTRLWDVLVVVEDRPGVIADVASRLAAESINIKDIEVLKVREGESGSLRLAFATAEIAGRALEILREAGYQARRRE